MSKAHCVMIKADGKFYTPWRKKKDDLGEQDGARLPPMWPTFDSRSRCPMWVEFVVYSRPCSERFFSGCSVFPLFSKTDSSKFQLVLERTNTFKRTSELLSVSWENKSHNHTDGILSYFLFQIPLLVPHL